MAPQKEPAVIALKVDKVSQLFDTLDPTPFRERDLDRDAEDYIVGWARELPHNVPIRIVIHLPAEEVSQHAQVLEQALSRYFSYRVEAVSRDLSELFRVGRYALPVGLAVLALCVTGGHLAQMYWTGEFGVLVGEGLIILGWVANWRPIEIFLYDWVPIVRHRSLLRRLASAQIVVAPKP